MSENYLEIIKQDKVYPIIRCKEPEQAIEISKALVEGGIRVLEINVENPSLYGAISEVSKFAYVCAGGIITSLQADAAFESGAKLIASPIFQMNMVKISKNKRVPFIAGASTAMKRITRGNQEFRLSNYILQMQWAEFSILKIF